MNLIAERVRLKRAQTSAQGFGELFDLHYERIYAYAYRRVGARQAAEDIAASVFEDAFKGIQKFRWQNKPIAAWLYKIAARRIADFFRARVTDELREDVKTREGFADQVNEQTSLRAALEKLSGNDQEIIRLTFFDELETAEIAALLNCSANNVYVRVHRALKRLKEELK
ncbi:MAG: sigma-70 family RNA polymerase sigma factor [Chloroflexi bacterium]|nr:sigma-70 family RNA polymerase sigma factor [Chloroflexota bacterium]